MVPPGQGAEHLLCPRLALRLAQHLISQRHHGVRTDDGAVRTERGHFPRLLERQLLHQLGGRQSLGRVLLPLGGQDLKVIQAHLVHKLSPAGRTGGQHDLLRAHQFVPVLPKPPRSAPSRWVRSSKRIAGW